MSHFLSEPAHAHRLPPKTGILLINLGTPEAPTARALRTYLKEFLSDPRVVEIPKLVWWPILNGIILNTRPKKSAAKYASIWKPGGSPLRVYTERQTTLLEQTLHERGLSVMVRHAMRYGAPAIPDVLADMKAAQVSRILILPLYPQYSASTTATAFDQVFTWALHTRNQPELRLIRNFHDHEGYIDALATQVRQHWASVGAPDASSQLIISFHGLPRRSLTLGDPYFCECHKTARLLAKQLKLTPEQYQVCFQSRFGKAEWLQPYTAPTLTTLARQGVKRVDVICPGFTADCLETLEEIALEAKDDFLAAGGEVFHYIPALNDSPAWINALSDLTETHLQGWPTTAPDDQSLGQTDHRARALGAIS